MSTVRITLRKNSAGSVCSRLRAQRNLSQSELAQLCGLTLAQIGLFERTGQCRLMNLRKIAAQLGVSLDALVHEDSLHPQPPVPRAPVPKGEFHITGLEYYRCRRHITKLALKEQTGISMNSIGLWGNNPGAMEHACIDRLLRLAEALDVTLDQLCEVHALSELSDGDRPARSSAREFPVNCLTVYRQRENLSFECLAARMGLTTREAARVNCMRKEPRERYIRALAKYERISADEFRSRYDPEGWF